MIDVRVAQEHGVDVPWVREPPIPIPHPQFFPPLEQAAVEQDPPIAYGDEVHRAGHRSGRAEKLQSGGHGLNHAAPRGYKETLEAELGRRFGPLVAFPPPFLAEPFHADTEPY